MAYIPNDIQRLVAKLGQLNGIIGVQLQRILRLDYCPYVLGDLIGQGSLMPSWR